MGVKALGISDADYRDMLSDRYNGKRSCTDLTFREAKHFIGELESKGFTIISAKGKKQQHPRPASHPTRGGSPRPPVPRDGNVIGLGRPEEIDKVNKVAALIIWRVPGGLALFLEKRMGIKDGKIRTSGDAYKAIEGLKKMFENQMKARHGEAWWTMKYGNPEIMTYIAEHCPREWR
jgi:hypothetical protein